MKFYFIFEIRPLFGKGYKEVVANSGDSDCLVQSSDSDIFPGYKVKVKEGITLVGVLLEGTSLTC